MTVGSQVKNCFYSVKGAEATLEVLLNKTQNKQAKEAFGQAQELIKEVKNDLQKQVMYLAQEEPQYK